MTKKNAMTIAAVALLAVVVLLAVTGGPPHIDSLQAEPARVFPSGSTQIECVASAWGGARLNYEWQASGGQLEGAGPAVTWTAPDSEGFYYISVNVTAGWGRHAGGHVMINVKGNDPPIINSLAADAYWARPAGSLNVTCAAEDYDGHALSYEWSASAGSFEGSGPEVIWTAPQDVGMYEITVTVSDDYGGSATRKLSVSVNRDQPPVIEAVRVTAEHKYLRARTSGEGYEVGEGKVFDITCIASHPYGMALSYQWECETGEISDGSDDGPLTKWTSPYLRGLTLVTVTVSDLAGNMARQSVILEVVSCSRFG